MYADDRTVLQDPDRTVLTPRREPAEPRAKPLKADSGGELQRLVAGVNPLLRGASTLLALVARLRATHAHADPAALRRQLLDHVREFEAQVRGAGVTKPQISAARYLLCSFLDETIQATPWGASGAWAERNLLQEFHDERSGSDKAFKLLERLGDEPAANAELLELFYVCLALGFEGRYRDMPEGRAQLDAITERLAELVRPAAKREATSRTLSLRWQGVAASTQRALSVLPLWVVFAVGAALLLGGWLWANARLDAASRPVFRQVHGIVAALRIDRSAQTTRPRLAMPLQADIAAGVVAVRDEPQRSVATLPADALFVAGSARVEPVAVDRIRHVARALAALPGQVVVVGHSDAQPLRSLQFPSNWHLTRARAQAVAEVLARSGVSVERLRAEGRADAEPVAPDDTEAGRARNRRIEVELLLTRPDR